MTLNTRVIKLFLHHNDRPYVPLTDGLRLQVLPDISYLPRCQKHHFAAFIADRGVLIVWDDDPKHLLDRAAGIENALMAMIWTPKEAKDEEKEADDTLEELDGEDPETLAGSPQYDARRPVLNQPIYTAITLILVCGAIALGLRKMATEIKVDQNYLRLLFVIAIPPQIWLGLFFFQALVGGVFQIIGPIGQMKTNSKYYSGVAPKRLRRDQRAFPHVTIQMPVYKEGLLTVIEPTISSIKAAISTYEMQGGTANIFVNDDGMQLLPEEDARARQDFYDEHSIGWVARPRHDPKGEHGEAFVRAGKFKKASNMNYALWVSNRLEDKLSQIDRSEKWSQEDEANAYVDVLNEVVEEDEGRTWADGNIRMGDYILIIDSDTRVPTDCFLDAVSEMEQCPQVAILQYSSGVMNVTTSFFEMGITYFTNLIYTQIRYAVSNGDVAPFVGHNAVLRWSAMQEISYDCPIDGHEKFWSEATVSEDFDMALRLQSEGYLVRMAAYAGDGFKEGVSLTVYDELARWEKYAYGCSELIFHPLKYWFVRGPFTPLFRDFITSCIPFHSKLTILAYVGTYYAIASSWMLTLLNYFITGWFNGHLDHYYLDSFSIYFALFCVFSGLGNVSLTILRYRTQEKTLFKAFVECFSWLPLMTIFLGGMSLHVSQAILSHLLSIDMSWGATSKEAENTTFWVELPKLIKKFKMTFVFCISCTVAMIVLRFAVPLDWQIDLLLSIYPLASVVFSHFMLPIALNPSLMRFKF